MNNDNKNTLIKLIFKYIIDKKLYVLQILQTEMVVLSGDNESYEVTSTIVSESQLKSNHEEADTKVVMHVHNILRNSNLSVVLRSTSGDTDILLLLLSMVTTGKERMFYDYGSGKYRKGMWLDTILTENDQTCCLISFHAFTGNDYVSSFFKKG